MAVLVDNLADAGSCDDAEEEFYQNHREEMLSYMRSGGIASLQQREAESCSSRVGLLNQGATCYMNSLLQALFFTTEFRLMLYRFRHDAEQHAAEGRCIPLQLQKLLAKLELTRASAISTRGLSEACGFSGRETLEQHDLEEFCRVLFTALEESSKPLAQGIDNLFSCVVTNVIRTRDEHEGKRYESKRSEKSFDIQVPVKGFATLEEALGSLIIEEQMDGDNQWFCEELGGKTDAVRFSVFDQLPQILCVHLNRFCFDPATWERRKISDIIKIPEVFDAAFLLSNEAKRKLGVDAWHYRLKAVCLHGGTAHGGHYHAFVFDGTNWYDANDSSVSPLDDTKRGNLFQKSENEGEPSQLHSTDAYFLFFQRCDSAGVLQEVQCSAEVELPKALLQEVEEENKTLEALQRAYRYHRDLASLCVYEPAASLVALRNYTGSWLRDLIGPNETASSGHLTVQICRSAGLQTALRKIRQSAEKEVEGREDKENYWSQLLEAPNEEWELFKYDTLVGEVGLPVVEISSEKGVSLEDLFGTDRFAAGSVPVLINSKLKSTPVANDPLAAGASSLPLVVCRFDPSNKLPSLAPGDFRLLHIRPEETKTDSEPPTNPIQGGNKFAGALQNLQNKLELVRRQVPKVEEKPKEYTAEDFSQEAPIFDLFASETPAQPEPHQSSGALVSDLRRIAAEAFGLDAANVALVPLTGSAEGNELLEDGSTLREEGIRWRDVICLEERPPNSGTSEDPQKKLGILELIDRIRNTTHLRYNHPDRPQYTEEFDPVAVSKDCTLTELKGLIAKLLDLDAGKLHLRRYETGPQLKAESRTLQELGLSDSSSVFVAHGAPCAPGEHLLKVTLYSKDPPPRKLPKPIEVDPKADTDGVDEPVKKEEDAGLALPPPRPKMCLHVPGQALGTVRTLRQRLEEPVVNWATEMQKAGHALPFELENLTWKRLRLRDGMAGKGFAILRDERKLEPSLLGLADGREVAVQVLDQDEELTPDDVIINVRPWRVKEAKLHAPTEVKVDRSKTLGHLLDSLTERFKGILQSSDGESKEDEEAEEDTLEVLPLPTTGGPPITIARCEKLRWGDSRLKAPTPEARETPLIELREVRDGATIVVRSRLAAVAASASQKEGPSPATTTTNAAVGGGGLQSQIQAKAKGLAKAGGRFGPAAFAKAQGGRVERGLVIRVEKPEMEAEAGSPDAKPKAVDEGQPEEPTN